jgi:hypothetical protein
VSIDAQRFSLLYGIREMICDVVLPDWNWEELGSCLSRHFLGNLTFVIFRPIKTERECPYRLVMKYNELHS